MKNPNNGIELYVGGLTNRFAVFTGNAVADLPLKECTTAVLTTLDKDMRRAEKVKYSASRDGDRELFDLVANLYKQKMARNSSSYTATATTATTAPIRKQT